MKYADQSDEMRFTKNSAEIRNKITSSTVFTKQPQLRSSRINSSTTTNIKSKLNVFQLVLTKLQDQTTHLLNQTNESNKYLQFLRRDLGQMRLGNTMTNCMTQIKRFENYVNEGMTAQNNHIEVLKQKCDNLLEQKQMIKSNFFEFKKRIERIQHTMGYYVGHQKHKS